MTNIKGQNSSVGSNNQNVTTIPSPIQDRIPSVDFAIYLRAGHDVKVLGRGLVITQVRHHRPKTKKKNMFTSNAYSNVL